MNYIAKAKDSFRTKMNIFLYHLAITDKQDFTLNEFVSYQITKEIVNEYTIIYWQELKTFPLPSCNKKIEDVEKHIVMLKKEHEQEIKKLEGYYVKEIFPAKFSEHQFNLLKTEDSECYYCGITEKKIIELANKRQLRKKSFRGWSLEIDRLDSNFEYTPDNCVLCCYWCNNAKTDEFTKEEFEPIGKAIRAIWQKRLSR